MFTKFAIALIAVMSMASCSSLNTLSGMGVVSQSEDKFNGSHRIYVTPNHVADAESTMNYIKIGAYWNSQKPDQTGVIIEFSGIPGTKFAYASITGISVRIDGVERKFKTSGITDFDSAGYGQIGAPKSTVSTNAVAMDLDYLRNMTASRDVKVRVHTSKVDMDCIFDIDKNGGGPLAQASLRQFVAEIDAYKQLKK